MKFGKFTALAIAGVMTFAACKYEEGPRISLRAKRDRVANEWEIVKFTVGTNDSDVTSLFNPTFQQVFCDRPLPMTDTVQNFEFKTVLNLYRTGSYGIEMLLVQRDSNNNPTYFTNQQIRAYGHFGFAAIPGCYQSYRLALASMPAPFKYCIPHGNWSFDKGHYKIQVKPDLAFVNDESGNAKNTLDWTIVKLAEKSMKLKGLDENNKPWAMELKAINKEPYFY